MPLKDAWGLDIGQTAIRLVRVQRGKGGARVVDFGIAPLDAKPDDEDRDEKVAEALEELVAEKGVGRRPVFVSVAGPSTFFRDFPLPAISSGKLSEIVSYEARQAIPYHLEEVLWDFHHHMPEDEGSEILISLVCCRRDIVASLMETLEELRLNVYGIQVGPVALANFLAYDQPPEGTALVLDAGARATDFLIMTEGNFWLRSISSGGNELTKVLASKFNLPWEEAEQLKKKMGGSKQADRVFQVVAPVLRSVTGEIQRSLGYYKSLYRGIRIEKVICAGNTFLLPGVTKFLADDVGLPATGVQDAQVLEFDGDADEEAFNQKRQELGVATGLALQAVGEGYVDTNLLPPEVQRQHTIRAKQPYAVVIALLLMAMVAISWTSAKGRAGKWDGLIDRMNKVVGRTGTVTEAESDLESAKKQHEPALERNRRMTRYAASRGDVLKAMARVWEAFHTINSRRGELVEEANELEKLQQELFQDEAVQEKIATLNEEYEMPDLEASIRKQTWLRALHLANRRRRIFLDDLKVVVKPETWYLRTRKAPDGSETQVLLDPQQADSLREETPGGPRPAADGELTPLEVQLVSVQATGFSVSMKYEITDVNYLERGLKELEGLVKLTIDRKPFATNQVPVREFVFKRTATPLDGGVGDMAGRTDPEEDLASETQETRENWTTVPEETIPFALEAVFLPERLRTYERSALRVESSAATDDGENAAGRGAGRGRGRGR